MSNEPVSLPLFRGVTDGANCHECPFSINGMPSKPICGEGPEKPKWIIVGEGPGGFETHRGRPFQGPTGQEVNKIIGKIGADRSTLWLTNATLCCQPPSGADVAMKERAAEACKGRLVNELSWFPGLPILTLGAHAARSVIPKPVLDAIDPPETIKALKKAQKLRQQPSLKVARVRRKAIAKKTESRLKKLLAHHKNTIITIHKARHRVRPPKHVLDAELARVYAKLERKAGEDAIKAVDLAVKERKIKALLKAKQPAKAKKKKPIKITDIVGTLFDVDVDGTGVRSVIPAIHPAALLRGGGASIGGSHSPDMGFVNLMYDAGKVQSLANGIDIRLKPNIEYALYDEKHVAELFLKVYHSALDEGAFSLDLETYVDDPERHHALMAYMARIKVIGLATDELAVSLSWDLLPPWAHSLLQQMLVMLTSTFHNGLYDRTVMRAYGFVMRWHNFDDTLLAHHAAFPGNTHKLQAVASQFYGVGPWKSEYRNQEETLEGLAKYNALDTAATHALRRPLFKHIARTDTQRVYDLDRKMSDAASHMHLAGMPVDRDINSDLLKTFSRNVKEARQHVEDIAKDPKRRELIWHYLAIAQAGKKRKLDPDDFEARYQIRLGAMGLDPDWKWKIGSGKHIAALLQSMGVELIDTTAGGDISTKKDVLESLVGYPIVRDILAFRENDKLLSTFCWPIFDRYDHNGQVQTYGFADHNDRIHPIWNIHRITGRWASQWPVVSNVPKDKWKKLTPDEIIGLGILPDAKKFQVNGFWYRVNKDNSIAKMVRPNLRAQIRCRPGRKLVGFDFCLAKGTLIDTPSGNIPIESLRIGDPVYSFNFETKRPDCSKVTNRMFTGMRKTLKVILDNGEEVRCTPDHRWFVRPWGSGAANVKEVQAKDLRVGMRLLPLRRGVAGAKNNQYETLYSYSAFEYVKTHQVVAATMLGPRPDDHHVHHKNEQRLDNRPSNLEYKPAHEHLSEHSTIGATAQWQDPKTRTAMSDGIKHALKDRGGHHGEKNPMFGKRSGIETNCPSCGAATYFGGKHPKKFCSQECYRVFRSANRGKFKRGEKLGDLNHKVAAIIDDGLVVPTYDIEVERDHNFALSAGVFVHNCQIEARVIALISGTPFLMEVFSDPKRDIHIECAQMIWEHFDSLDPDTRKALRENVKNIEYGYFYMAQLATLHQTMLKAGNLIKIEDLAKAIAKLAKRLPEITEWQQSTIRRASQPPYEIKDFILGRRRTWPMGNIEAPEAVNYGVQTAAASIMNTGMAEMQLELEALITELKDVDGIAQIHDAAVYECWADDAEKLAGYADAKGNRSGGLLHQAYEQIYERDGRTVPFKIETKIGDSWDQV